MPVFVSLDLHRSFFFNDTATTEIYTLSLHDALPILFEAAHGGTLFLDEISETKPGFQVNLLRAVQEQQIRRVGSHKYTSIKDRKSTRLNSSHMSISYAVFCLKKKNHHSHHSTISLAV